MFDSISNLIGGQTGVNSGQLLSDLVAAAREPKEQQLNQKASRNQAKISALGSAKSALNTFSTALGDLLNGKAFQGDITSSDPTKAVANYTSANASPNFPITVEIIELSSKQSLASDFYESADSTIGRGRINIRLPKDGNVPHEIAINASNDTLAGLRDAINDADIGVKATIINERRGARIVLEGPSGNRGEFEIDTPGGKNHDLAWLAWPPIADGTNAGATDPDGEYPGAGIESDGALRILSRNQGTIAHINGVRMNSLDRSFKNVFDGIDINLKNAKPDDVIVFEGDPPESTASDLVREFVDAYNELRTGLNDASRPGIDGATAGPLSGERAIRDMINRLGGLTSKTLNSEGPYRSLADIGVQTNRDGTLTLDTERLDRIMSETPELVVKMLDPAEPSASNPGLASLVKDVNKSLGGDEGSLSLAEERYRDIQTQIREALEEVAEDSERYREQLQNSFAGMDRRLALLRQTQTYLSQQIAIWNGDDNN